MTLALEPPIADAEPAKQRERERAALVAAFLLLNEDDAESDALALWDAHVPKRYRGLIDNDGWTFDPVRQRYTSDTGTALAPRDQKALSVLFANGVELDLEDLAKEAATGKVELTEWEDRASRLLAGEYLAQAMLGVGGAANLTDEDVEHVVGEVGTDRTPGSGLAEAMARLRQFAEGLAAGGVGRSAAIDRAGRYAHAGHGVYEEARRSAHGRATDEQGRRLFLYERNVLDDAAEHCRSTAFTEGCPDLTAAGWMPIGVMPAPGYRSCWGNCRCHMEYSLDGDLGEADDDENDGGSAASDREER